MWIVIACVDAYSSDILKAMERGVHDDEIVKRSAGRTR